MFIANLMASVLALAMVGASTASVSKIESNSVGSDVVLNRDLHKAYYDSGETYATGSGNFYNYSSYFVFASDDVPTAGTRWTAFFVSNQQPYNYGGFELVNDYVGLDEAARNYLYFASVDDPDSDDPVYTLVLDGSLDVYYDGVFAFTTQYNEDEYFRLPKENLTAGSYIWVFDHASAPDPYTPVDMLGDIAEGLTGGIVPVAEGIGEGLQSLVQDIFLNDANDGLSVFGIVIVSFCGLALAFGLSRWVLNFVDSLGARDR